MLEKCDVLIIGAGPGGYVSAIRCAQLGLKTVIVEKEPNNGGTCLNVGCIPSKTLLHFSEQFFQYHEKGELYASKEEKKKFELDRLMQLKSQVIKGLDFGILSLLKKNKVTRIQGLARFLDPHTIEIQNANEKQSIQADHIIIATGSEPVELPFLPFDEKKVISSTGGLSLEKVPDKMIVIGAGAIGLELGSVYHRLGSKVVFIEFLDHIAGNCDPDVAKLLLKLMQKQGMEFHLSTKVENGSVTDQGVTLTLKKNDSDALEEKGDIALVSVGRKAYSKGLGAVEVGIKFDDRGCIIVDASFKTSLPHIYALGDIVNGPMLAHKASEEGVAVAELIAGHNPVIHYSAIPNVIYTFPELATVGFTESEAKAAGLEVKSGSFSLKGNSRAHCIAEADGLVKIVTDAATDRIIGMHLLSPHASELVTIGVIAVEKAMTSKELSSICFPHPTFSEAIKEAALNVKVKAIHM